MVIGSQHLAQALPYLGRPLASLGPLAMICFVLCLFTVMLLPTAPPTLAVITLLVVLSHPGLSVLIISALVCPRGPPCLAAIA